MSVINWSILYVNDPLQGRPLFYGQIFVGLPDLDPEVVGNQKQLNVIQEDGTVIPVTQPLILSAGGNPVYNGETVRLDVDGNYSIKILDKNGAQKYYIDNVFDGQPITSDTFGDFLAIDLPPALISDLSQAYEFATAESLTSEAITFPAGKVLNIKNRGAKFIFTIGGTVNGYSILDAGNGNTAVINEEYPTAKMYGLPTGEDDGEGLALLDSENTEYTIQEGTYLFDSFTTSANRVVHTAGIDKTIFKQNSGILTDTRIINIDKSDVTFGLEGFTVTGNIATDTGEQKHGVFIRNLAAQVDRVKVGNFKAVDLRGDALYIGGNTSYNPRFIEYGDVYAFNCIRNGVSITGGDQISGGNVYAPSMGLFAYDIEPDTVGGIVGKVTAKNIYGRQAGILGQPTQSVEKDVQIESVYLDGALGRSTPTLGVFSTDGNGLVGRNTKGVQIKKTTVINQEWEAITAVFSGSDVKCDNWHLGECTLTNNNTDLSQTRVCNISGFKNVTFGDVTVTAKTPGTEVVFQGATSGALNTRLLINSIVSDTKLASYCSIECGKSEVSYAADAYCVQNLYDGSIFENAIWNVGRVAGFNSGRITFIASDLNWDGAAAYDGTLGTNFHVTYNNVEVTDNTPTTTWYGFWQDGTALTAP